jgi:hypothetical protein
MNFTSQPAFSIGAGQAFIHSSPDNSPIRNRRPYDDKKRVLKDGIKLNVTRHEADAGKGAFSINAAKPP